MVVDKVVVMCVICRKSTFQNCKKFGALLVYSCLPCTFLQHYVLAVVDTFTAGVVDMSTTPAVS